VNDSGIGWQSGQVPDVRRGVAGAPSRADRTPYERLTEMSVKHADSMEQAGQHEAAARLRKSREEARQGLVRRLASGNGISEAQVEDIYQTGKRENWDR